MLSGYVSVLVTIICIPCHVCPPPRAHPSQASPSPLVMCLFCDFFSPCLLSPFTRLRTIFWSLARGCVPLCPFSAVVQLLVRIPLFLPRGFSLSNALEGRFPDVDTSPRTTPSCCLLVSILAGRPFIFSGSTAPESVGAFDGATDSGAGTTVSAGAGETAEIAGGHRVHWEEVSTGPEERRQCVSICSPQTRSLWVSSFHYFMCS